MVCHCCHRCRRGRRFRCRGRGRPHRRRRTILRGLYNIVASHLQADTHVGLAVRRQDRPIELPVVIVLWVGSYRDGVQIGLVCNLPSRNVNLGLGLFGMRCTSDTNRRWTVRVNALESALASTYAITRTYAITYAIA